MAIHELHFDSLPRPVQMLIFAALIAGVALAFYNLHLKDLLEERDRIQAEIDRLEFSVSKETEVENQLKFFNQELSRLKNQFDELKSVLSMQKDMPEVLRNVQQMAASSNLKINRLSPDPLIRRTFCADWPIRIEAAGNFDGLGLFFEKIGQATRAIHVEDISIKAIDNPTDSTQTLTAGFTATVFIFREELTETPEDNESTKNALTETRGAIQP